MNSPVSAQLWRIRRTVIPSNERASGYSSPVAAVFAGRAGQIRDKAGQLRKANPVAENAVKPMVTRAMSLFVSRGTAASKIVCKQCHSVHHDATETPKMGRNLIDFTGVPDWIRTSGLRFRKPLLYPAELPRHSTETFHATGETCHILIGD